MKTRVFMLLVVCLFAASACKKAKEMAKYKERATALAAKYGPQLGELSKKLPELASHAKDLPVNVPGVDKLAKLIEENKGALASAQDVLAHLPEKLAKDTPEQAEKDLAAAEAELDKDVKTAEADEKEEAEIEAAAAKAAPADTGAGSAAGSGAGSAAGSATK